MTPKALALLLVLVASVLMGGCATGPPRGSLLSGAGIHSRWTAATPVRTEEAGGAGGFPGRETGSSHEAWVEVSWGRMGVAMPPDWPDLASRDEELLAPLLGCSPAEFVEVQQGVDMPRLVEALEDWSAVRLGALGPIREDAAGVLHRKRASFVVRATERYGVARAEVLALFLLHSCHDDELEEVLRLLARDKRLGMTLGLMPTVREELERRGLRLAAYPDRAEQSGDVLRGLGRAARDALSSSPLSDGARYVELSALREQLPPPYQKALDEVERAQVQQHFSPGNVVLGSFDSLTFGVPLGFYSLVASTGRGVSSLSQGQYEQATSELAPAALLAAVYAGGKAVRFEPGSKALERMARQLEGRLGVEGLRELARDIRASREAGHFVAVGGVDAAIVLREARGDVAKAQVWLSQGKRERAGPTQTSRAGNRQGSMGSLVDEEAGLTPEVVEAKLARVERDSGGPRLPGDVAVLEKQRPALDAPLPGAQGNPRWREYVAYYENRVAELEQGKTVEGPLRWEAYEQMRRLFARGLAFERTMVELLRADAALPRALRRYLGDFNKPRVETYVGVWKPEVGLRFVDVLVIEEGAPAGSLPRVETFSFKSRNLSPLKDDALETQMIADASEALEYYGETLDIGSTHL